MCVYPGHTYNIYVAPAGTHTICVCVRDTHILYICVSGTHKYIIYMYFKYYIHVCSVYLNIYTYIICVYPGHIYIIFMCIRNTHIHYIYVSRRAAPSNSPAVRCVCFRLFASAPRLLLAGLVAAAPASKTQQDPAASKTASCNLPPVLPEPMLALTAIPRRMHRISSDLRS